MFYVQTAACSNSGHQKAQGGLAMDKKYMAMGTSMLLLKLLEQQDMYGYQIIRELEKRSNHIFSLKEGTLYPLLHSLEQQGAVACQLRLAESGRQRKYYLITDQGRKLLRDKLDEWDVFQTAVNQVIGGALFG